MGSVATERLVQGPGTMRKWPVHPVSAMQGEEEIRGGEGTAEVGLTGFIGGQVNGILSLGAAVPPAQLVRRGWDVHTLVEPPNLLMKVAWSQWPGFFLLHVMLVCSVLRLLPWDQQYPSGGEGSGTGAGTGCWRAALAAAALYIASSASASGRDREGGAAATLWAEPW